MTPTLRDIALSILFFTRLPLPHVDLGNRTLAQAIWAAPLTGLIVAIIAWLACTIAASLGLSPSVAAALALAASLAVTGALHEDGLSDVADGFGGGKTRDKKLEIMRDSRIGAFGAAALMLSLLIRWTALADLAATGNVFLALAAAHMASRGPFGAFMNLTPPARSDGLSVGAGAVSRDTAVAGLALGALALLPLGLFGSIGTAALLAVLFFAFRRLCLSQIGGQTGDTIGTLQQLGEILVLLAASAILT